MTTTVDHVAGLPIQEVARRTGFSESTLRYYERIGLVGPVPRDQSSSHRRYSAQAVGTLESLACLRSTGMSIEDMRAYLEGVAEGGPAAPRMADLFAGHAQRLEQELAAVRVRHAYATAKAALWQARADGDQAAEQKATVRVLEATDQLRRQDRETRP
ncbi:MAG TPA: MerR family transcriptional regulator [Streptosporangiaceae bacterium]|jgi:DNA-binding transcriptional MerR regulator